MRGALIVNLQIIMPFRIQLNCDLANFIDEYNLSVFGDLTLYSFSYWNT